MLIYSNQELKQKDNNALTLIIIENYQKFSVDTIFLHARRMSLAILQVYKILGKLTRLRSLRLENGGCWCKGDSLANGLYICTCNISETLSKLKE